jgi:hypothetical protein
LVLFFTIFVVSNGTAISDLSPKTKTEFESGEEE